MSEAEQIPGFSADPPISRRSENVESPVGRGFSIAAISMTIRWYQLAVFALWLAAMSWLTVRKILPPFYSGEPPVYESSEADRPRPPVGWYLQLDDRRLGWALSEINQQAIDTTEIHSLVHFDNLPLEDLLPLYLRAILRSSSHNCG